MEIDKIKLTQIEKAEYNPRNISEDNYQKLKNSVKNFGLVEPILVNLKNNHIISGHQRYDVLTDLLLTEGNLAEKEFYMIKHGDYGLVLDTDEPTLENEDWEKALNITLNNTNLMGHYDFEKLGNLFDELSLTDIDITLTGFDEADITSNKLFNEIMFDVADEFNFENIESYPQEENIEEDNLQYIHQVKCPHCGEIINLDKETYANL